jgi:hypothetical protein
VRIHNGVCLDRTRRASSRLVDVQVTRRELPCQHKCQIPIIKKPT